MSFRNPKSPIRNDRARMTRARLLLPTLLTIAAPAAAQDVINYTDHIKPIFMQACSNCHNADRARGGLDLTSYSATMSGGSAGEIVTSMDPGNSRLIAVMAHTAQPVMPPNGGKVADEKIELVRRWVEQGCRERLQASVRAPSRPSGDSHGCGRPRTLGIRAILTGSPG